MNSLPTLLVATALLVIAVTGCEGSPRTRPSTPSGPGTAAVPPSIVAPTSSTERVAPALPPAPATTASSEGDSEPLSAAGLEGTWSSPRCGERSYERLLRLHHGELDVEDRVSPCPPKARCVWSGIVQRRGRYRIDGARLLLELGESERRGAGARVPSTLALEPGPVEPSAAGATEPGCRYVRRH